MAREDIAESRRIRDEAIRKAERDRIERERLARTGDDALGGEFAEIKGDPEFDILAGGELESRRNLGELLSGKIGEFTEGFRGRAKTRLDELSETLLGIGQKQFERANPFLLQDLQSRGLATSPTAVRTTQEGALGDIALRNQDILRQEEGDIFRTGEGLLTSGLEASLAGEQTGVESVLDLLRSKLSQRLGFNETLRQQDFERGLSRSNQRASRQNALIGGVGSVLGGFLGNKGLFG